MAVPQRRTNDSSGVPGVLIAEIERQIVTTGGWSISSESLCSMCGIQIVDYYRGLYSVDTRNGRTIPNALNGETVLDVLEFLESYFGPEVRDIFSKNGVYFDYEIAHELSAQCVEGLSLSIKNHSPDIGTYEQMLKRYRRHDVAFETYRGYFFNTESILEDSIGRFVANHSFSNTLIAQFTAKATVNGLITRNVISISMLFLRLAAVLRRATDPSANAEEEHTESPILKEFLKIMGFRHPPDNIATLRRQYKALMKTYHPDINPTGLELSQKINEAYGYLIAQYQSQ